MAVTKTLTESNTRIHILLKIQNHSKVYELISILVIIVVDQSLPRQPF